MKKVILSLIGALLLVWVGVLISKYVFFPIAASLNLVKETKNTEGTGNVEERWENIKSKLNLQPIYKGESKLVLNLCSGVDQKEAASIAYLGIGKDGNPRFQISRPHWIGENKYWVEPIPIPLAVGEALQLACGYRMRLDSFDPEEAWLSTERW